MKDFCMQLNGIHTQMRAYSYLNDGDFDDDDEKRSSLKIEAVFCTRKMKKIAARANVINSLNCTMFFASCVFIQITRYEHE